MDFHPILNLQSLFFRAPVPISWCRVRAILPRLLWEGGAGPGEGCRCFVMLQVEAAPCPWEGLRNRNQNKTKTKKSLECSQCSPCAAQTFWKHWAAFNFFSKPNISRLLEDSVLLTCSGSKNHSNLCSIIPWEMGFAGRSRINRELIKREMGQLGCTPDCVSSKVSQCL